MSEENSSCEPSINSYLRWRHVDYRPVVREFDLTSLLSVLRPGDGVLEIGCGRGSAANRLASSGMTVEGWDINPAAIQLARTAAIHAGTSGRVNFVHGDFLASGSLPSAVDAVVLLRVLTCLPDKKDWQLCLDRARQCLKIGGFLYVRDFLISPETYAARYARGFDLGWRYGTFGSPEGKEPPDFVAYHHSVADVDQICETYQRVTFNRDDGLSHTGRSVRTFELLARKADDR